MTDLEIGSSKAQRLLNSAFVIRWMDRLSKLVVPTFSPYTLLVTSILHYMKFLEQIGIPIAILQIPMFLSFLGTLYNQQDTLMYRPSVGRKEGYCCIPKFWVKEEVYLTTSDDKQIHGLLFKQPEPVAKEVPTVLYFHGNCGSIAVPCYLLLHRAAPVNIFAIDYRGYGKSEGAPSEQGLYNDADTALAFLLQRHDIDTRKIILFGHSLGGAIAIHLATMSAFSNRIAGLIVMNTFTSIRGVACARIKFLRFLPGLCIKNKFDSLSKISSLKVPALFLVGEDDWMVPPEMSRTLYERCEDQERTRVVVVRESGHNNTLGKSQGVKAVSRFLNEFFDSSDSICNNRKQLLGSNQGYKEFDTRRNKVPETQLLIKAV